MNPQIRPLCAEERAQDEPPPVTEQITEAEREEDTLSEGVATMIQEEVAAGEHAVSRAKSEADDKLSQYSSLVEDLGKIEGSPEEFDFKIGLVMEGITGKGWGTN